MSIKRTIITAVVGLTLVALVAPAVTQAYTVEELTALVAQLSAQLAQLQGGSTTTVSSGACAGVTFNRNLTVGATGSDVKCLQVILNAKGFTVATTGAGSPGAETTYFGSRTLVAVKKYQQAKGFTPANQVGPMTRAALTADMGTTGTGTGTTVPTGAGLSVALAYDNPASGSVLSGTSSGQSQAPLAKLTFVNGDNAAVKVTTLKLHRIGVSSDSALSNVYLFNGAIRVTDAAAVSAGVISFNDSTGLFTVPANSSITISVTADMAAAMTGTIGIALNASTDVTTTASSVKGNFPLNGNLMNIVNSGTNLATAYFSTNYATNSVYDVNPSGSTLDPQSDVTVWNANANVNISNGTVKLARLALQEVGSIAYSDVTNLRLFVSGVQVSNSVANLDANGYVTFDLSSSPIAMNSGTKEIKVLADIVGGSSRTFSFQLKTAADVTLIDSQYNVNITPTVSNGTTNTLAFSALRSCYTLSTTTYGCTINSGATTTSKTTDSPSGNVVNAGSGVTLAKYTLKANGERIKVDSLKVYALFTNTVTTDDDTASATSVTLRNAALYANGVQVGNTFNLPTVTAAFVASVTPATVNLGSSLIIDPLTPVTLEVKADIYDNSGVNDIDATDILQVKLVAGSGNGTGMISSSSANVPTSLTAANQVTVAQGSIEVAQQSNYANQNIVVPQTAYKLAAWNLSGNSSEAVNVNTIAVNFTPVSGSEFSYLDLSNVYVKYGSAGSVTSTKTSVAATGTSWSVSNFTVPVNGIVPVEVYADIGSTISNSASIKAETTITGLTASSSQTASTTAMVDGQTIVAATGSFTGTKDAGSTAVTQIVPDNNTVQVASYKFTAVNDSYKITKLTFTMAAAGATAIKNNGVVLKDGTTEIARTSGATTMVFNLPTSGVGSVQVIPGTPKVLTVSFELGTIGVGAGTSGGTLTVTLDADSKAIANSSGVEAAMSIGTGAANALYAYAAIPTISMLSLPSSVLAVGTTQTLAKFQISSNGTGTISWNKMILNVAKSTNPTIANSSAISLWDADSGAEIACSTKTAANLTDGAATNGTFTFVTTAEQEISGAKTYLVKATIGGSATVNSEYISVYIPAQSINYVAPAINSDAVGANGGGSSTLASFVWSDESAQSHDTTTADWNNDWLVKNLPTDSWRVNY